MVGEESEKIKGEVSLGESGISLKVSKISSWN